MKHSKDLFLILQYYYYFTYNATTKLQGFNVRRIYVIKNNYSTQTRLKI